MDELEPLRNVLPGTAIAEGIREVISIYREADAATASFSKDCRFSCPPSCGICCEGFYPELLAEEADLIAVYLVFFRKELIALLSSEGGTGETPCSCPMYDPDSSLHCRIYPVRPLVCRSFGFTGSLDKGGKPVFRLCKHMPHGEKREYRYDELGERGYSTPPLFTEHGLQLSSLSISPSRKRFADAVRASLFKVYQLQFLGAAEHESENPDDSEPPKGNAA